jgi:hypothetical protein
MARQRNPKPLSAQEQKIYYYLDLLGIDSRHMRLGASGSVWLNEAGNYDADLDTSQGQIKLRDKINISEQVKDLQSAETTTCERYDALRNRALMDVSPSAADLRSRIADQTADVEQRSDALHKLIALDDRAAAQVIISELSRPNIPREWVDHLICASEYVQFSEPRDRTLLGERLYNRALALLGNSLSKSEPILWAAIRRYATLIPTEDAGSLLPFLGPKATIGTRQVALQGIQAIFELDPPSDPESLGSLTERVISLCETYIDPDVVVSAELGSLAVNSFLALSLMGREESVGFASRIKSLDRPWLARRAAQSLSRTRDRWHDRSCARYRIVDACLDILNARG